MSGGSASDSSHWAVESRTDGLLLDEKCGVGIAIVLGYDRIRSTNISPGRMVRLVLLEEVVKLCAAGIVSLQAIEKLCPPGVERNDDGRSTSLLHAV